MEVGGCKRSDRDFLPQLESTEIVINQTPKRTQKIKQQQFAIWGGNNYFYLRHLWGGEREKEAFFVKRKKKKKKMLPFRKHTEDEEDESKYYTDSDGRLDCPYSTRLDLFLIIIIQLYRLGSIRKKSVQYKFLYLVILDIKTR